MNFRKTSKEGGWVISDPKISLRIFALILRGKSNEFSERGGGDHSNPKNFVADLFGNFEGKKIGKRGGGHAYPTNFVADFSTSRKKTQHSFPRAGGGGGVGGQRPFGGFPKIHPFM